MAADRLRIVVIGLPELGHLLEVAEPHGIDVVTVPRGSDVGAVLADKARGATRDTLLFVVADCGDQAVNGLPDTLARAGFRGVVLAGLPGASGTFASHDNLHVLPAPFSANDVLAALSALPDVPFFLPVAGGDRIFGELAPVVEARPAVVVAATATATGTGTGGRRERNGILFPRRERPDDDPLGPPVRVFPLDPLPAPPPPPPVPTEADVTPIFAIPPAANPAAVAPTPVVEPTPPAAQPVALAPEPSVNEPPPPAPMLPVASPETEASVSEPVSEPPPPAPVLPVAPPEPEVSVSKPVTPAAVAPMASPESEPPPAGLPVVSREPELPVSEPPPAPVLPVASPESEPPPAELPVVSYGPEVSVSEPLPPGPVLLVTSADPEASVSEPLLPPPVLLVTSADPEASMSEPPPAPVLPITSAEPEAVVSEPPPAPVLPVASAEPDPVFSEPLPAVLPVASPGTEASVSEPLPPAPVLPVTSPEPESSVSEPLSPVALAEPEPVVSEPPPGQVLPVTPAEPEPSVSEPLAPVALAEPEPVVTEPPPAPVLPVASAPPEPVVSEPPPGLVLPVASAPPEPVASEPPPAPVLPMASPEPKLSASEPLPPGPVVPVASPEPEPSRSEPLPPVMRLASPEPELSLPSEPPPVDGGDGMPGWAQLPAVPVGVERADGAWARSAPAAGALWVATPRLPAYQDEPVMPGARLPAPQSPRGQRRGEVISVCSYKGGSGKCLTGDSLLTDPVSGVPRRLDDIVRDPAATTILTLDGDRVRAVPIAAKIDSGVQPTVRVEFASGRSVTVTPHHPFLLADGWHPAERIAVGEAAALPGRIPFPAEPRRLPATEIAHLAARLSDHGCRRPAPSDNGAAEAVYRLPEDQLGHFLALLWTADGTVGHDGIPSLELAAEASVRMVQHLLLRFGVQSRLTPAAGAQGWRLAVGPGDRATFARHVPLCGLQRDRLMERAAADPEPCRQGDVAWDQVTAIQPAGTQQVWDLTVDVTHCFVANDIVVHNTTTAVLAAATLARAVRPGGKRVALVDANTAQSSVGTILQRPARGSILDLVRTDVDEDMLALALTPIPEAGDLDVLFGAPDLRCADERLLTPTLWRRVVAALRRTHDYVIVDTPVAEAVGHELFDDFVLRDSSLLLVVLDPNRETIHNNVEWLDIIGDPVSAGGRNFPPDRVAIVLNRADPQLAWNEHSVGDHFRRYHYLGAIPHSTSVQQAADDARLVQRFDATVDQAVRHMLAALLHEPLLEADAAGRATGSALDRLLERLFRRGARAECSPV